MSARCFLFAAAGSVASAENVQTVIRRAPPGKISKNAELEQPKSSHHLPSARWNRIAPLNFPGAHNAMATYTAEIIWSRSGQKFTDNRYSRRHVLRFDGGIEVSGSSSPHVVPLPYSAADAVDPEEAFVASLSSCHMLWFLSIAVKHGFVVDNYQDAAEGVMARNEEGKLVMTVVTLRPEVRFSGERNPAMAELEELHRLAHDECFIANSVKTEVRCEPRLAVS